MPLELFPFLTILIWHSPWNLLPFIYITSCILSKISCFLGSECLDCDLVDHNLNNDFQEELIKRNYLLHRIIVLQIYCSIIIVIFNHCKQFIT
jgi:uncharacterized membrane protein